MKYFGIFETAEEQEAAVATAASPYVHLIESTGDVIFSGLGRYAVDLNDQWQLSDSVANPDVSAYEGVYESFSNYNVNSGVATMYIDIEGYTEFTLYIRSYAESNYDYVMVSQLDQTITGSTSYSNTTLVKAHTRGSQSSGTAVSNYKEVTFTEIPAGTHRITIVYRKDSSDNTGTDKGYVLIKRN